MGKTRRNNISFFMKIYINMVFIQTAVLLNIIIDIPKKVLESSAILKIAKYLNFCLDAEEEIGEDVENTWDFKRK